MEIKILITYLQLFGIGFTFGIVGPCLFFCVPIIASYVAASQNRPREAIGRIISFLTGRIIAYAALGYAAGLSGEFLRRVINSQYSAYFKVIGGVASIILGVILLVRKDQGVCSGGDTCAKVRPSASVFLFGFLIGCAPCAPLAALLAEIAIISKTAFQGGLYALSFGAGTFVSGLIVAGSLAGMIGFKPFQLLRSVKARLVFRMICAGLLILFGITLL